MARISRANLKGPVGPVCSAAADALASAIPLLKPGMPYTVGQRDGEWQAWPRYKLGTMLVAGFKPLYLLTTIRRK